MYIYIYIYICAGMQRWGLAALGTFCIRTLPGTPSSLSESRCRLNLQIYEIQASEPRTRLQQLKARLLENAGSLVEVVSANTCCMQLN